MNSSKKPGTNPVHEEQAGRRRHLIAEEEGEGEGGPP